MASLREIPGATRPTREQWGLVGILLVGLVLRAVSITGVGHTGDLFALRLWAVDVATYGVAEYYARGGVANYPPLLYLLGPLGTAFQGVDLQTSIRALSIPFDLALGSLLFVIGRRMASERDAPGERGTTARGPFATSARPERVGLLAAAFYLLNPAVIVSGPLWGQVDGIGALPMVGAVLALASRRVGIAAVLATLAGLIKPQFGIAGFIVAAVCLLEIRRPGGLRRAAVAAGAAVATFLVIVLPLGLSPGSYANIVSLTADRYPYFSLYGFNPWAIAFGFGQKDGALAYEAGLVLTALAIAAALTLLSRRRDLAGLLGVAALIGLALYFIPTRVHERYLFGAVALIAPLAALQPRLRLPFIVLSALFLVTLLYVLGNTPIPGVSLPDWARGSLAPWEIWLVAGSVTVMGLWCAWEIGRLYRSRAIRM